MCLEGSRQKTTKDGDNIGYLKDWPMLLTYLIVTLLAMTGNKHEE
ncbi:MAG: hypothetical protein ACJAYN_001171 [Bermanella sp.]|jgi:hypothetical protein